MSAKYKILPGYGRAWARMDQRLAAHLDCLATLSHFYQITFYSLDVLVTMVIKQLSKLTVQALYFNYKRFKQRRNIKELLALDLITQSV